MKIAIVLTLPLFLLACQKTAVCSSGQVIDITQTLERQARAWTDNDLDGFMAPFHRSDTLRFAHPKGITLGWQTVYDRYGKSIAKSRLEFSDLDVTVLADDAALVFGRFHNYEKNGAYHTGLFTLLMKRIDGRWKVVHDHSSDLPDDWKPTDRLDKTVR